MKKKEILVAIMVAITILMVAGCNTLPDSVPIMAQNVNVVGAEDNQLSVVNELYKLSCKETSKGSGMWLLNLRVKFKAGSTPMEVMDSPYLVFTDENGEEIEDSKMKVGANAIDNRAIVEFKDFAKKDDNSEQTFCFYVNLADKKIIEDIMNKAKNFVIYVGDKSKENSTNNTHNETGENVNNESATNSIEAILPNSLIGKVAVTDVSPVTVGRYGFPEIDVTFKLLSKVNTSSLVNEYGQLWIVGVGLDAKGRKVKELLPNYEEWRTNDSDGNEFKEFLEGAPESTINMTFTGGNPDDNREVVEGAVGKVTKFQMKITK